MVNIKKHKVEINSEYIEFKEMNEYKFQIRDDYVAENLCVEILEQGLANEVVFNQSENTITVEVTDDEFKNVSEFISEYGFILE